MGEEKVTIGIVPISQDFLEEIDYDLSKGTIWGVYDMRLLVNSYATKEEAFAARDKYLAGESI